MPEILRKIIMFRGRTPQVDAETATEILEHIDMDRPPANLSRHESVLSETAKEATDTDTELQSEDDVTQDSDEGTQNGVAEGRGDDDEAVRPQVVFADHDPETVDVVDADSTLVTATYDEEDQRILVEFRASEETVESCTDMLAHVLERTTLETGKPPKSSQFLDVQIILDSHVEPYNFTIPDGKLFRTKRTADGKTALRLTTQDPLELESSADIVIEEIERALSLTEQV